jgi:pimeloyl-ACP methyl ester carboxylesterase
MRLVMSGADIVRWLATKPTPGKVMQFLGVPPDVASRAGPAERAQAAEFVRRIQPLSRRIEGICNEASIAMVPLPLERISSPTLVISVRDDLYNTLPAAQHLADQIPGAELVVFESGGHLMIGRQAEVNKAIFDFLAKSERGWPVVDAADPGGQAPRDRRGTSRPRRQ